MVDWLNGVQDEHLAIANKITVLHRPPR